MWHYKDHPKSGDAYIVFRGVPSVHFISNVDTGEALEHAQKEAAERTESTGEMHTVMHVPNESLALGVTAVNLGVVFHATESLGEG